MPSSFHGKAALITGSGSGIGRGIAIELARQGARIVLAGIELRSLVKTRDEIVAGDGVAEIVVMDQGDEADCIRAVVETVKHFGQLDILVNNAGVVGQVGPVAELDVAEWQATFQVNLTGVMVICREAVKVMTGQKSGVIINISSNVARRGFANRAPYVCSKWALNGLGQTLALETAKDGIRVNTICPGPVLTERLQRAVVQMAAARKIEPAAIISEWERESPMGRLVTLDECVQVALFLASDSSSAFTGQALNVTAGAIMT